MTFYGFMRLCAGALAVALAISLIHGMVSGRWRLGGQFITRAGDAKTYWLLLARHACTMVGLALVATIIPERLFTPVFCLLLFGPALAFALLTGRFEWEVADKRIDSPRRFWGWVTFYAVMVAFFVLMLVMELSKAA